MKPRPFDYARPDTVAEAVALLAEYGDEARVLAGGQSLMAMLNLRLAEPAVLIDIARIAELDAIRDLGDRIEVGAAVTQNKLLAWPALSKKLPLSLAVLEGEVVLQSERGTRTVAASDFQIDMLTTAREPDELITAVRFPVATNSGAAFREVARRHGDFAIIAVGAVIEGKTVRLGVGGMAGRPIARRIALDDADSVRDAVEELLAGLDGYEDLHASAELRRDILRNLAPVVIAEAQRCAA